MKGEYLDLQQLKNDAVLSKLTPFSHHFHQLSRSADDDDHHTTTYCSPIQTQHSNEFARDGASIEVTRRPRGRPPGSKNKPRQPVFITREPEPSAMSPVVLEIPGGNDVVEALSSFSSRRNIGICVLTGSGTVANVTLRQPSTTPGATITFHGQFDILSINATFLPQTALRNQIPSIFTISLAGPQGQVVGGAVAAGLISAGPVILIAASFNNPNYHLLSGGEEDTPISSGGGEGQSPPKSGSGGGGDSGNGGGVSMYSSCHMGSDVLWAAAGAGAAAPPVPPRY